MGARPALAQLRQRVVRMPKPPKVPRPVVSAASTVTAATTTIQDALTRTARSPAFGVVIIASLIFTGVEGATAPPYPMSKSTVHGAAITPVAAVTRASTDPTGPLVVAALHPKVGFHIAEATASAPPPTVVVNTPGALGIPMTALTAYRNAERMMATADPNCGISWNLLAGIGRIESGHANNGATDVHGTAVRPIYGPTLDGTLPGNEVVVQGNTGGRISYARAMGPMQFLPGTWARYAADGDGDGKADPQNLYDSTLAAARYLCSGGLNLRDQSQVLSSILRYNNSMPYAQNVLGWAAAYATGVIPVDLPPITGPPPPLGDAHLENAEGLGPNLPLNMHGLPSTDPLARVPLIDLSGTSNSINQPVLPWQQQQTASAYGPSCTVICIGTETGAPQQTFNTPPSSAMAPAPDMFPAPPPNLFSAPPPAAPPPADAPAAPAGPPPAPAPAN
ncbi:lytic transglycosylase domain-containing protein [Mycobacterium cookii]|uniref:Membrane protein n=2 Tax=Mycobacterium cookii TaxID=1775 RepID=A0A7I7KUQ0_9MYCO|nr:membrane protein [Mycobacterium cookii]